MKDITQVSDMSTWIYDHHESAFRHHGSKCMCLLPCMAFGALYLGYHHQKTHLSRIDHSRQEAALRIMILWGFDIAIIVASGCA